MVRDFLFRIQPVLIERRRCFQLRIGMYGERELDFIPAHTSAFAQKLDLQKGHETEAGACGERDALVEWLKSQIDDGR